MTKIDDISLIPNGGETVRRKQAEGQGKDAFKKALDEALSAGPGPEKAAKPAESLEPFSGLAGLKAPVTTAELDEVHTEGVMRAERALGALEQFERALGDQGVSLKQMAPMAEALEAEVAELNTVIERLGKDDRLRGLLEEVAVTAMVQAMKFNRGDHLPT